MTTSATPAPPTLPDARTIAEDWIARLRGALAGGDPGEVAALFLPSGWWRDLLALTWDLRTFSGAAAIGAELAPRAAAAGVRDVAPAAGREPLFVQADSGRVQAFFSFATDVGRGLGHVVLMPAGDGTESWLASTALTTLDSLDARPEAVRERRPRGIEHGERSGRTTWAERRAAEREFADADPAVLIIGAGQAGLALGARLGRLGVPTLLVERNERVGDNWRRRYRSLVLHDPVWFDHMPYLPFPEHWPVFSPKDKLAGWLEAYAEALELNVWTGATVGDSSYDAAAGRWSVAVRRPDGSERILRPAHLVLATGMSGVPSVPEIPGAADFAGAVCHSSAHLGAHGWAGKRAVVVGTATSGHDIAQDFYEQGAHVTMLQRSPTYVLSTEHGIRVLFGGLYEEGGPPTADADLLLAAIPFPLLGVLHQGATKHIADLDADLLAGLEKAGFKLGFGPDGAGIFMLYLTRGGGYYIDVGASQLIADGKISIRQGEVARFVREGLELTDGAVLPADIVVLATGYANMRESARAILGDAVADRCGPVWGLDDEGELRTIWRRSGHEGLWFMGGNLQQCRFYSKYLALQIAAVEAGVLAR